MDANKLDIKVSSYSEDYVNMILLEYNDSDELENTISFLSLRHCGFLNMLDDFLLRCGVSRSEIRYEIGKY
jgi:hypothetical protein